MNNDINDENGNHNINHKKCWREESLLKYITAIWRSLVDVGLCQEPKARETS